MKKMLFCAAAAIAALASCSKTQVVYNDAPEEIAFKQITGVMTKTTNLDQHHTSMGVFANVNDDDDTEYFGNTSFSKTPVSGESYWVASPTKYWPFQTELQFIVYAPYLSSNVSVSYSQTNTTTDESGTTTTTTNIPTLEINDFTISDYSENRTYIAPAAATESSAATLEQLNVDDLMYGEQLYVAKNQSSAVAVNLKHALSRVEVNVKATVASVITINSIVLNGVTKQASLSVAYSDDTETTGDPSLVGTLTWSQPNNLADNKLDLTIGTSSAAIATANDLASYGNPFLVIPGNQTTFTINYTLNGVSSEASVHLNGSWDAGKKYIYDFTFTLNEIKLTPTVTDWVEGELSGSSTDNNITVATKPVTES